ncbi:hypothetical protein J2Z22_001505 [Paenibacillus forsythiae]|uniref:Uncharacterized protein n=1 Tax=Paenibacillus forsythiae TaxID=365616 RepID=A0ABU3H8I8_9BACL|nr:hypothetical protein [Paenibacillus forsythiae]MDT3425985.1 hypothetical protein [Paenibacillus forsythiae]
MKKKSAFIATLSLAMVTIGMTASASPSTTQENAVAESSVIESPISNPFIEDHLISPSVIDISNPIGDTVTGGAVVQKYFTVNAGYGHIKLLMKNYSSQSVTVSLTHNYTGIVYFSRVISGKGSLTWKNFEEGYEQGMRGGGYTLQWSGGGSNVNGEFFGKTGSSISDVTN